MLREDTVFGPIYSRRLGQSLGINLLPREGKLCNFDCIYCECGWNRDGLSDRNIPSLSEVRDALADNLERCSREGVKIDSITFSGDGEPTLHPDFPAIVDVTLSLRDRFFPEARVSVLSNATRISRPSVFEALRKVDAAILKIDAPTDSLASRINRPQGEYSVRDVVESLKRFEGRFVLQTMFLKSPDFDSSSGEVLSGWMDIVREVSPREIMVYTIARETPMKGLAKFTVEEMTTLLEPLLSEGYNVKIFG